MPATLSKYYSGELAEWIQAIIFYEDEIDELEGKFNELIRRESLGGVAAFVNNHQMTLQQAANRFNRLHTEILEQQSLLKKPNGALLDDKSITESVNNSQAVLRLNMQAAEKEFIDIKFGCYKFLSGLLKK